MRVTDLVPGAAGSKPKFLINVNGKLFFAASQPTTGDELWASDGTPEGTILIKDINPGFAGSQPNTFAIVNGLLYFRANDGVHGEELWRSDGTAQGTFLVGDINPGRESSRPLYTNSVSNLPFAGPFVFPATDPVHGRELWTLVEINVAPSFVLGPNITVWDQAGPKKVTAWAKQLVAGPPDEAGQRFTFLVTVDKPHLFLQPPAIDALGNLKFTPKPGLSETARITVVLRDDGGTANGGMDQTAPQTFAIKITRNPWLHNRDRPRDVDGDNHISASDALSLINLLNAYGPSDEAEGELSEVMYYDVNDDGFASAGDALDVINHLNAFGPAEGEPATTPGSNDPSATDEVFAAASSADALSALFDLDAQSRAKRRR